MDTSHAQFRFYAELNDFLPAKKRHVTFDYQFTGTPSIKDAVEAIGVPHPEVELILVNGASVGWKHHLASGDEVSVYPVFESLDVSPLVRLRPEPLRLTRFIADSHLGRLARWLRMLGFDAVYETGFTKARIIEIAARDHRLILSRDRRLLRDGRVTHAYWVRATQPRLQIEEVVQRFDLRAQFAPFKRCMECNGDLVERRLVDVADRVPTQARKSASTFHQCAACGHLYWDGTHVARMRQLIEELSAPPDSER